MTILAQFFLTFVLVHFALLAFSSTRHLVSPIEMVVVLKSVNHFIEGILDNPLGACFSQTGN